MATVTDVLLRKGCGVATVSPEATVLEAAQLMNRHRIGSLVVVSGPHGGIRGIITERDILTRVVAVRADPHATQVREAMTAEVYTCPPNEKLDQLREVMRRQRIRHVPVIDQGGLCGLISIGDLNAWNAENMEMTISSLEEYIQRG